MSKRKVDYKAPFLPNGSVPQYPNSVYHYDKITDKRYDSKDVTWREVEPFYADLRFIGIDKGSHGSTRYVLENLNNSATYNMFTVDVLDILMKHGIDDGVLHGYWVVQKRGQNYGVRYIGREEPQNA